MVLVEVSCPVNPSEIPERVATAVTNIFPDCEPDLGDGVLTGSTDNLDAFSERIRELKILDAARAVLYGGRKGDSTVFNINKQVAYVGKISFCEEDVTLGSIRVTVRDDNLTSLIDRVAPHTVDGEEVSA